MKNAMILSFALLAVSGCSRVQMHLVDRPRVDQDVPGMPEASPVKTRKVVEVRVISDARTSKASEIVSTETKVTQVPEAALTSPAASVTMESSLTGPESQPLPVNASASAPAAAIPADYKVEKDDTLQKIAKKFYGSYGKWTKIYDANKDVIKDPNFLKSGTILKIPAAP